MVGGPYPYVIGWGKTGPGDWSVGAVRIWDVTKSGDPVYEVKAKDVGHDFYVCACQVQNGTLHLYGVGRYTNSQGITTNIPYEIDTKLPAVSGGDDVQQVVELLTEVLRILGQWPDDDNLYAWKQAIQYFLASHRMATEPGLSRDSAGFPPGS
jgi:hypothetical protein